MIGSSLFWEGIMCRGNMVLCRRRHHRYVDRMTITWYGDGHCPTHSPCSGGQTDLWTEAFYFVHHYISYILISQLEFPDPYFLIWDEIFNDLTSLIQKRQLREAVQKVCMLRIWCFRERYLYCMKKTGNLALSCHQENTWGCKYMQSLLFHLSPCNYLIVRASHILNR